MNEFRVVCRHRECLSLAVRTLEVVNFCDFLGVGRHEVFSLSVLFVEHNRKGNLTIEFSCVGSLSCFVFQTSSFALDAINVVLVIAGDDFSKDLSTALFHDLKFCVVVPHIANLLLAHIGDCRDAADSVIIRKANRAS